MNARYNLKLRYDRKVPESHNPLLIFCKRGKHTLHNCPFPKELILCNCYQLLAIYFLREMVAVIQRFWLRTLENVCAILKRSFLLHVIVSIENFWDFKQKMDLKAKHICMYNY